MVAQYLNTILFYAFSCIVHPLFVGCYWLQRLRLKLSAVLPSPRNMSSFWRRSSCLEMKCVPFSVFLPLESPPTRFVTCLLCKTRKNKPDPLFLFYFVSNSSSSSLRFEFFTVFIFWGRYIERNSWSWMGYIDGGLGVSFSFLISNCCWIWKSDDIFGLSSMSTMVSLLISVRSLWINSQNLDHSLRFSFLSMGYRFSYLSSL